MGAYQHVEQRILGSHQLPPTLLFQVFKHLIQLQLQQRKQLTLQVDRDVASMQRLFACLVDSLVAFVGDVG